MPLKADARITDIIETLWNPGRQARGSGLPGTSSGHAFDPCCRSWRVWYRRDEPMHRTGYPLATRQRRAHIVMNSKHSADGAEDLPLLGNALQGVRTEILELDAGASDQVFHRARDEHVVGAADMRNARSNMDGNSAHIVLRQLHLASMHADAHWNVEPMQLIANGAGAVNRARRSVEGGQETVAQGLHLLAAKPRKLLAHCFVMSVEKVAPCPIALGVGALR